MLSELTRTHQRDVKRLMQSLAHLTKLHGPRTFTDLVKTSGRDVEYVAKLCEWMIVHGYMTLSKSDGVLRLTIRGKDYVQKLAVTSC